MPYSVSDVDKHKKGLTDKEKEQWVSVANSVLASCMEDGGDEGECAAKAIQQASGVLKRGQEEASMPNENEFSEYIGGLEDYLSRIRGAFYSAFRNRGQEQVKAEPAAELWVRDIFSGHPEFGDAVVVEGNGGLWAVPYTISEDGMIAFADAGKWEPVIQTYLRAPQPQGESEIAETELAESASGHVLSLAEAHVAEAGATGSIVPLHLDVALITPGWGNSHDNHYYPREVIERDSGVFAGVKMYETDHRQDEKSTRTWVSTVKEIAGYTSDGAPIGRVSVHDRNFAERLMAQCR